MTARYIQQDQATQRWGQLTANFEVDVDSKNIERYMSALVALGSKPPIKRLMVIGYRSVLRNFQEGGRPKRWAPLAESTLTDRRGGSGSRPLQDEGYMKKGVTPEALGPMNFRIIARDKKSAWHQFGTGVHGPKGAAYMIRRGGKTWMHKGVPARPFVVWQRADIKAIEQMLLDHLRSNR